MIKKNKYLKNYNIIEIDIRETQILYNKKQKYKVKFITRFQNFYQIFIEFSMYSTIPKYYFVSLIS